MQLNNYFVQFSNHLYSSLPLQSSLFPLCNFSVRFLLFDNFLFPFARFTSIVCAAFVVKWKCFIMFCAQWFCWHFVCVCALLFLCGMNVSSTFTFYIDFVGSIFCIWLHLLGKYTHNIYINIEADILMFDARMPWTIVCASSSVWDEKREKDIESRGKKQRKEHSHREKKKTWSETNRPIDFTIFQWYFMLLSVDVHTSNFLIRKDYEQRHRHSTVALLLKWLLFLVDHFCRLFYISIFLLDSLFSVSLSLMIRLLPHSPPYISITWPPVSITKTEWNNIDNVVFVFRSSFFLFFWNIALL